MMIILTVLTKFFLYKTDYIMVKLYYKPVLRKFYIEQGTSFSFTARLGTIS